jgi:AbrB family looped-hinge helix DNA binding protein
MSKVTSKLQVTIPKAVAEQYGIEPGTEVAFEPAGDAIRVRVGLAGAPPEAGDLEWKLRLFDAASKRQKTRNRRREVVAATQRGWIREELYAGRGVSR